MTEARIDPLQFHGQPALSLTAPDGAKAVILLHGAHLVSWIPAGGAERLYLSERAVFDGKSAVRGGVPIIFPQFAERGSGPRHGFARTRPWQVELTRGGVDFALASFTLRADAETRSLWPHDFRAEFTVSLSGARLDMELDIANTGTRPFQFSCALHSYLRVADVETVRLEGLQGVRYESAGAAVRRDNGHAVIVDDEIDRIYCGAPDTLLLREPHRALALQSENFPDVVVWNPWEVQCRRMADMPADGFRRMLCIEAARVAQPLELAAGAEWCGRQCLVAV
ncbi:MAG: D-hexose-6-phosphate mutarotase [Rhodocyclaceae bacterium]|nr:D-hexose-6-phosphate mutarotase [Rhodocyclaceae bacterium]MBX3670287.1 D-hexose-6-phosphate mutarotase [Rhodocyclaceae bacterium]